MRLTILRYSAILALQTFLFLMDFGINTFSVFVRRHNAITLIMFMWVKGNERVFFFKFFVVGNFRIQDVCLILALAALLLTFFSTYVFQVRKSVLFLVTVKIDLERNKNIFVILHFKLPEFQAGLLELLYDRFRLTIIICMLYFLLTITLHIWTLTLRWKEPLQHNWTVGLHVAFSFQKLGKCIFLKTSGVVQCFFFVSVAPLYYYFYKRAALRISDPRFYEDVDWNPKTINNWRLLLKKIRSANQHILLLFEGQIKFIYNFWCVFLSKLINKFVEIFFQ